MAAALEVYWVEEVSRVWVVVKREGQRWDVSAPQGGEMVLAGGGPHFLDWSEAKALPDGTGVVQVRVLALSAGRMEAMVKMEASDDPSRGG